MKYFCFSLLLASALSFADTSAPQLKRIPPKSTITRNYRPTSLQGSAFSLGLGLGFDGLWGKVNGSDVLSKGLGYSLGLSGKWEMSRLFRVTLAPSYQYMRLGRPMDGSGKLIDPNPANFEQSVKFIGVTGTLGMRMNQYEPGLTDVTEPQWWVELGGEGLFPLSASQTASDSSRTITAQKEALLLIGGSGDFFLNESISFGGTLQTLINLAGNAAGRFYGVRLLGVAYWRL